MRAMSLVVAALALGSLLACGGLARKSQDAPPASEPTAAPAKGGSISFGVPPGWTRTKEQLEEGGDPVVYYTIDGEDAAVQLVLRKAGVTPPTPAQEVADASQGLKDEIPGVVLGEPTPITRELSGQSVEGLAMSISVPFEDGSVDGQHRVWVVQGSAMSAVVVVDVPDSSVAGVEAQVDEVLNELVVP